jgi:hypothetical protein
MQLTDENFMLVAMHRYDNCQLNTIDEFQQDINRLNCIQKLIEKYLSSKGNIINIRLVLNHTIILHNAFGSLLEDMFLFKFPLSYLAIMKPVMEYLQHTTPDKWKNIGFDMNILILLRNI